MAVLLTSCSSPAPAPTPSPSATATAEAEIPDTPAGEAARWVLDRMNAAEDTTAAEWAPRLHPDFLAEVSAEQMAALINMQIRPARPLVPTAYRGRTGSR